MGAFAGCFVNGRQCAQKPPLWPVVTDENKNLGAVGQFFILLNNHFPSLT